MSLNILKKITWKKEGIRQMITGLIKGEGVGEMLTMTDKEGRGGWGNADND